MRLLLMTQAFPPDVGGTSTWSYELARQFAMQCNEFAVLAPVSTEHEVLERGTPFELIRVKCPAGTFPALGSVQLGRLCARRRFDVLLGADWTCSLPGLMWRRLGGPPRIFSAVPGPDASKRKPSKKVFDDDTSETPLQRRLRARVLNQLDGIFPASSVVRDWIGRCGVRLDHAEVVTSGCNAEHFRPGPRPALARELGLAGRRVLLSVSQLVKGRGLDSGLFALSSLGIRYPDLRYVIAGDGPERTRLELLAERLRISHKVRFLGHVNPVMLPQIYQLCDIFLHAPGETHPDLGGPSLVLLEASASGKPVVSTRHAGSADLVVHEQTGLVIPPSDSAALERALTLLLEQPEYARQLGERGRASAEGRTTWDQIAARLIAAMSAPAPRARADSAWRSAQLSS